MAPRRITPNRTLALAYIRVSTGDQAENGASLAAQTAALIAEAERRGWDVEVAAEEGLSGKDLNRPALQAALARLDRGEAQVLIAIRLDRISRSVADFAALMARAKKRGWRLLLQNPALDTEEPSGKFTAHVLAAAAEYERDLISARTKEGMAQRRVEGVHLGRARVLPLDVLQRIVDDRAAGLSLRAIAEALTDDGIATAHGGAAWHASTVKAVLDSETGRVLAST